MTCQFEDDIRSCHGKMTIQDFKPRNVGFSLGISCRRVHNPLFNLKELTYNIILSDMSNNTQCLPLTSHSEQDCSKFYSHSAIPNLIGHQTKGTARSKLKGVNRILKLFTQLWDFNCYQHLQEFLCYVFTPKCDPDTERMVPPCRESCLDFLNGCAAYILSVSPKLKMLILDTYANVSSSDVYNAVNCSYLPPANGSIPCFYKNVTCSVPPQNQFDTNSRKLYPLGAKHFYVCHGTNQRLETGNNTMTCLHSGQWSEAPECRSNDDQQSMGPLPIILPIFIILLIIFFAAIIARRYLIAKRPKLRHLKGNRDYDAFVVFNFDQDNTFVFDSLIPELEEKHHPPFKLFTHDRDFELGQLISSNIDYAIKNSSCAIIVLSQGFIDSKWCKEEFAKCLKESERDPLFKILVILMQGANTLVNVPENMEIFFQKKTYSQKEDPRLFKKISKQLVLMKEYGPEDDTTEYKAQNDDEEKSVNSLDKSENGESTDDDKEEHMKMLH